ncbi:hypothetical protein [Botrytis cinerea RNA virus 2]|nr:hypothetical protein [Botrytis cinerea RNA virus 2]
MDHTLPTIYLAIKDCQPLTENFPHGEVTSVGAAQTLSDLTKHLVRAGEDIDFQVIQASEDLVTRTIARSQLTSSDNTVITDTDSSMPDVITGDHHYSLADYAAGTEHLSERNLLPVDLPLQAADGAVTAAIFSTDNMYVKESDRDGVFDKGATTVNTIHVCERENRDYELTNSKVFSNSSESTMRNVITLLCATSMLGEFKKSGRRGNTCSVTLSKPLLSTSHLVETGVVANPTQRNYDVAQAVMTKKIEVADTNMDRRVILQGKTKYMSAALRLAYSSNNKLWKSIMGELMPPISMGEPNDYKSLMRNALCEVDMTKAELCVLVAEAAAACAKVAGMSDEAAIENLQPMFAVCDNMSRVLTCAMKPSIGARDVTSWIARGTLSFEAGLTRLFSIFTRQTDCYKWQRRQHVQELYDSDVVGLVMNEEDYSISVGAVLSTNVYGKVSANQVEPSSDKEVTATGHRVTDKYGDERPLMKKGLLQTRTALIEDSAIGAATRRTYKNNTSKSTVYSHSVSTDVNEYIEGTATTDGVQLTNVLTARATAGIINATVAWNDTNCMIDGTDRCAVNLTNGFICGPESRLTTIATELKRYGFELRLDDSNALGVGNTRREYAFTTNEQQVIAVPMMITGKRLSKEMEQSAFADTLRMLLTRDRASNAIINVYRQMVSVQLAPGIISNPMTWYASRPTATTAVYGLATFKTVLDVPWRQQATIVKSSSLDRPPTQPGGFNKKLLVYKGRAQTYKNEFEKYTFSADFLDIGISMYPKLTSLKSTGVTIPQKYMSQLLNEISARVDEDMNAQYWGTEGLEQAIELYKRPLGETERASISRTCWHVITGYIVTMIKLQVYDTVAKLSSERTPYQRLVAIEANYSTLAMSSRYLIAMMVGLDASWANAPSIVHMYYYAKTIQLTNAEMSRVEGNMQYTLSHSYAKVQNGYCTTLSGRCMSYCYGMAGTLHKCARCGKEYECQLCKQSHEVLTGREMTKPTTENVTITLAAAIADTDQLLYGLGDTIREESEANESIQRVKPTRQQIIAVELRLRLNRACAQLRPAVMPERYHWLTTADKLLTPPVEPVYESPIIEVARHDEEVSKQQGQQQTADQAKTEQPEQMSSYTGKTWAEMVQEDTEQIEARSEEENKLVPTRQLTLPPSLVESDAGDTEHMMSGALDPPSCTGRSDLPPTFTCLGMQQCAYHDTPMGTLACLLFNDKDGKMIEAPNGHSITEQEHRAMEVVDWAVTKKNRENAVLVTKCGVRHEGTTTHWCALASRLKEDSIGLKLLKGKTDVKVTRPERDWTESEVLAAGGTSRPYFDMLRHCPCEGCKFFANFDNEKLMSRALIDCPVWHYDWAALKEKEIEVDNSAYRADWGSTRVDDRYDGSLVAVLAWLAAITGRQYKLDRARTLLMFGNANIWANHASVDTAELENGAKYSLHMEWSVVTTEVVNFVHMLCECKFPHDQMQISWPYGPYSAMPNGATLEVRYSTKDCKMSRMSLRRMSVFYSMLWENDDTGRDAKVFLEIHGAMIGDMNHYHLHREVVRGQTTDNIIVLVMQTCTTNKNGVAIGNRLKVSKELAGAIRNTWGDQTLAHMAVEN